MRDAGGGAGAAQQVLEDPARGDTLQKPSFWYPGLEELPGICSFWGEFPFVGLMKTIWPTLQFECVHSGGAGPSPTAWRGVAPWQSSLGLSRQPRDCTG